MALTDSGKLSMEHKPKGEFCSGNQHIIKSFDAASHSDANMSAAVSACDSYCVSDSACGACSVDEYDRGNLRWNAIPSCGEVRSWKGATDGDISIKTTTVPGNATLTLTGPADAWFAVGLDAKLMTDMPYTLVVNSSGVYERKIGTQGGEADHNAGHSLSPSISLVSSEVSQDGKVRTVVVTRPYKGATGDHYTFSPSTTATINYIAAVGAAGTQSFSYHRAHAQSVLTLTTPGSPTCVCDLGSEGQLCAFNGMWYVVCGMWYVVCGMWYVMAT
jgi:hypothetical protein